MKKMKNKNLLILIILSFLILLIICLSIKNRTNIPNEDNKIIQKFFNSYLEQFKYSDEEWENIIESLESKMSKLSIDDPRAVQQADALSDDPWMIQWEETLTEKEIERLIKNGWLPNLYLKEYPETEYTIEKLRRLDNPNSYSINIKLGNIENKNTDEKINISLNIIDTGQGRRIDYIDFEEFNLLFKQKK